MSRLGSRLRAPSVRSILLVAAILPTAVLGLVTIRNVLNSRERVTQAEHLVDTSARLQVAVRLRAALSTEMGWHEATSTIGALGLADSELISTFIDLDPTAELVTSQARVDDVVVDIAPDHFDFDFDIEEIRALAGESFEDGMEAYRAALALVEAEMTNDLVELGTVAVSDDRDADLRQAIALAESASGLQVAAADELSGWVGVATGFGSSGTDPRQVLVGGVTRFDLYRAEVERLLPAGHPIEELWYRPEVVLDVTSLQDHYRNASQQVLEGDLGGDFDLVGVLGRLDEFSMVADVSQRTGAYYLELADASLENVVSLAAEERAAAIESQRSAVLLVIAVVAGFIVWAVALSKILIGPLTTMGRLAEALQEGSLDQRAPVTGPRETRMAARAFNAAVDQLKLAERQAGALAEERLDDDVLETSVPGMLGASLQQAVSHLTSRFAEREQLRRRLEHEAAHDSLTNLPNRKSAIAQVRSALGRAGADGQRVAVLFIDIDHFKSINDRHGHAVGDEVLQRVAMRLGPCLRTGDLAGRIGGDEFLVVAEQIDSPDAAVALAERVLAEVAGPVSVGSATISPTISVGVALGDGGSHTADQLVSEADLALYRAKEAGRDCVRLCDDQLRRSLRERHRTEEALAEAIDQDALRLEYQPIVDAVSGEVRAVEALVRWTDPEFGDQDTETFVAIAERSDLILALDRWVLRTGIRQLARWRDDSTAADWRVSINISGRHLASATFVPYVLEQLEVNGVDPRSLYLEITEGAVVEDLEVAGMRLRELREVGVGVALDDFGTGYASLAHLRGLPISVLKIDRSFVAAMGSAEEHSLIQLVIDTASLLGVAVVAEGVETEEQAAALAAMGCHLLQGYYFDAPAPADRVVARLSERALATS